MFANRYGHFEDDGRAFVVTDRHTPAPWVNVISNGRYGLTISHNGGGFSFFDDAQHCVITRWDMDLVRDVAGKYLYLADLDSGAVWSLAPAPTSPAYESYRCRHGIGTTRFETALHGIESSWTIGVADSDAAEIWLVKLTNTSSRPRRLRLASYLEWCCGVAPDTKREFHKLFITTRYDPQRRAIFATKNMWDIPPKSEKQHWNQPWPYCAAHAVAGVTFDQPLALGDKSAFLGRYGPVHNPGAMHGAIPSGRFGRFTDAIAALGGDLTLAPGQSVQLHYVLVIGPDGKSCGAVLDKYLSSAAAELALEHAERAWEKRLAPTSLRTERADFDLLNNHWLKYQAISGRLWGRTGYYQQSGAFGFRDQLQDTHVWLPLEPARCLAHIEYAATRQFVDGSVNHWWHALADFGNHTRCSDDYLWLPYVLASYVRETGDFGALSRARIGFMDDPEQKTDLMDHCLRAIRRALARTSPRGIPYIGSCDWNDGLSALGVDEKGESVWLGWFLCEVLEEWSEILSRVGKPELSEEFRARRELYIRDINEHAWDGAWYRCATRDSGEWIGASRCTEGQIHLNPQTWSIIAGAAPDERRDRAWASVKQRLLSSWGPLLLAPAYTVPDAGIGYITRYSPGSRENGGVYMHAATWALLAACKLRDTDAACAIWNAISPPTRCEDAEGYWAEPYVLPGNVDGPLSEMPGRAGWTWYTGSAAWLNKVSLEWVLGIRPVWNGLLIDPCLWADLGTVRVRRLWRGRTIELELSASAGPVHVELDGRVLPGGLLKESDLPAPGGTVRVRAYSPVSSAVPAGVHRHPRP